MVYFLAENGLLYLTAYSSRSSRLLACKVWFADDVTLLTRSLIAYLVLNLNFSRNLSLIRIFFEKSYRGN